MPSGRRRGIGQTVEGGRQTEKDERVCGSERVSPDPNGTEFMQKKKRPLHSGDEARSHDSKRNHETSLIMQQLPLHSFEKAS